MSRDVASWYARRREKLGMDPNTFEAELRNELYSQLCCAWEEVAEQHAEQDDSLSDVMKAAKEIRFSENHIVVIGKDNSIQHFKFLLERMD